MAFVFPIDLRGHDRLDIEPRRDLVEIADLLPDGEEGIGHCVQDVLGTEFIPELLELVIERFRVHPGPNVDRRAGPDPLVLEEKLVGFLVDRNPAV